MIYGTHMETKRTHGSGIGTDPAQDTQDHIKLIVCIIHSPHGCRTCPGAVWSRTNFVQNNPGTVRTGPGSVMWLGHKAWMDKYVLPKYMRMRTNLCHYLKQKLWKGQQGASRCLSILSGWCQNGICNFLINAWMLSDEYMRIKSLSWWYLLTHMGAKHTHGSGIGTDPARDTQDHIKLIVCIIHSPYGKLGVRVPLRSRHEVSQKLWHFLKNTRSCVENECCCPRTVNISNVNFKYIFRQIQY